MCITERQRQSSKRIDQCLDILRRISSGNTQHIGPGAGVGLCGWRRVEPFQIHPRVCDRHAVSRHSQTLYNVSTRALGDSQHVINPTPPIAHKEAFEQAMNISMGNRPFCNQRLHVMDRHHKLRGFPGDA